MTSHLLVVVDTLETVILTYSGTAVVAVAVEMRRVETVLVSVTGLLTVAVMKMTVGTVVVRTTSEPLMKVVVSICVSI